MNVSERGRAKTWRRRLVALLTCGGGGRLSTMQRVFVFILNFLFAESRQLRVVTGKVRSAGIPPISLEILAMRNCERRDSFSIQQDGTDWKVSPIIGQSHNLSQSEPPVDGRAVEELLSLENPVKMKSNVAILRFRRPPEVPPVGLPVCPTTTSPITPVTLLEAVCLSCCSQ